MSNSPLSLKKFKILATGSDKMDQSFVFIAIGDPGWPQNILFLNVPYKIWSH